MLRTLLLRSSVFASLLLAAVTSQAAASSGSVTPWRTPFGQARLVRRAGATEPQQQIEIRGRRFIVGKAANGAFTYTNDAGKQFVSVPREGASLVTPFGVTKTVKTADGEREVLKARKANRWETASTKLVSVVNGRVYYSKIDPLKTPYGETETAIVGDRLVQRLTLKSRRYEVTRTESGTLRYTDGKRVSKQVIEDERGLVTPEGVARQMTVGGEKAFVVVDAEPNTYQIPPPRRYRRVEFMERGFKYHDITAPSTPYGVATVVRTERGLRFEIKLDGKRYRVEGRDGAQRLIDANGKPFVDAWARVVQTPRAVPVAAKRLYDASLKKLPEGAITQIGGYEHMSQAAYDDLRDAMIETMEKLDPRTHYFIGLGSDPHPIIAFLSNLGGRELAINFPASGKYSSGVEPSLLTPYARQLIPPEVLNGSRTIVLLDQTNSGATLKQVAPGFEEFLRSMGSPAPVERLAYSSNQQPLGTLRINTNRYAEVGKFLYPPYEHVTSQYPRHVLGTDDIKELKERPEYVQFRAAMKKRMQRDAKLDAFLAQRFSEAPQTETQLAAE